MSMPQARTINPTIRSNLEIISSILSTNTKLLVSDSVSSIGSSSEVGSGLSHPHIRKLYPRVRLLLENLDDPFKILGLYTQLISASSTIVDVSLDEDP